MAFFLAYKTINLANVNVFVILISTLLAKTTLGSPQKFNPNAVRVNKCCEKFEVLLNGRCADAKKDVNTDTWQPTFTNYEGVPISQAQAPEFRFVIGVPDCGAMQRWPVYHYPSSTDKLELLSDGKLRHYILKPEDKEEEEEEIFGERYQKSIQMADKPLHYDYEQGQYCMDKSISTGDLNVSQDVSGTYAMVCTPEKIVHWTDSDFLLRKIINPIFHGIAMIILLTIAVIYFVLPTLRDLVGNIVTTITLCLIVSQAADLVRILTEFSSHVSFLVADTILYVSLLAAFFWLNSMGYYIWKTFRSRNVFLRVTDGRKYCWYSCYAWGLTCLMAALAIFSHFFLDTGVNKKHSIFEDQETIGWLGIAVFFTPIAFTIIINIFFYVTTLKVMRRMNTYGRIHHKLRCSFVMFTLLLVIMSISWFFLILSWVNVDAFLYLHIIVNAIQAPAILYVTVLRQKHVTFLLKKSCCYNEPTATTDWGDELTYMNGGDY